MSIAVRNLSFSYGAEQVLRHITFSAEQGQLIALLGPNGAGKSTLFKCMLGLLTGYTGEASIDGDSVRGLSAGELARRIAYIPQSHYPSFNFSVFDMVLMGTTSQVSGFSSPRREQMDKADQMLQKVGMYPLRSRGFMQISGGERQLVLIARALVQDARVLLMDEPTSSLDYGNQLRVMEETQKLARDGYCILQSTHHPDHAFLYAHRILALKDGTLAADGAPRDVLNEELLTKLYGVDVSMQSLAGDRVRLCVPRWVLNG